MFKSNLWAGIGRAIAARPSRRIRNGRLSGAAAGALGVMGALLPPVTAPARCCPSAAAAPTGGDGPWVTTNRNAELRVLAYGGEPVEGGTLSSCYRAIINDSGQVAFYAEINPRGHDDPFTSAFRVDPNGTRHQFGTRGTKAPDTTTTFESATVEALTDDGWVFSVASLQDGTKALYRWRPGEAHLLVQTGAPLPAGQLDDVVYTIGQVRVSTCGHAAIEVLLDDIVFRGEDALLYMPAAGSPSIIMRTGDAIPGTQAVYQRLAPSFTDPTTLSIDDLGNVALLAQQPSSDYPVALRWNASTQQLQTIAYPGATVPGGDGTFAHMSNIALGVDGQVTLTATFIHDDQVLKKLIMRHHADGLATELVRTGDASPVPDRPFTGLGPAMPDREGNLVFLALIEPPNDGMNYRHGIFRHDHHDGTINEVVLRGDILPELWPDTAGRFEGIPYTAPLLADGLVLYTDRTTNAWRTGLWLVAPDESPRAVTLQKDWIEYAPSKYTQVIEARIHNWSNAGADSASLVRNQHGQLVFHENTIVMVARLLEPCPGDADFSRHVSLADLLTVIVQWGACDQCPGDLNDDGMVGVTDLLEVLAHWGPCE